MNKMKTKLQGQRTVRTTREKVLRSAIDLMLSNGYNDTTIDRIVAKAGVTKGGFFHYFRSKEDLALAVAKYYMDCRQKMLGEAGFNKEEKPARRVLGMLDFLAHEFEKGSGCCGCILGILAQEVAYTSTKIRSLCAQLFNEWAQRLEKDLAMAWADGAPQSLMPPRQAAEFFISLLEGSMLLAKANQDRQIIGRNLRQFKRFLEAEIFYNRK